MSITRSVMEEKQRDYAKSISSKLLFDASDNFSP